MTCLLSFGHGFSARALTPKLLAEGWDVLGTTRTKDKAEQLRKDGVTPVLFGDELPLDRVTHVLVSAGPND
ncbi:MAG: SDR family NAD(P)-dependent oxidoreductase, partial [Pseudomonadota bacterium]